MISQTHADSVHFSESLNFHTVVFDCRKKLKYPFVINLPILPDEALSCFMLNGNEYFLFLFSSCHPFY